MKQCVQTFALASFVVLSAGCRTPVEPFRAESSYSGAYGGMREAITLKAAETMKEHGLTGLSLALVNENGIVFTVNLGYADAERKIPVTSDTIFRVGSIAKLFTATAVMQLSDRGVLDVDRPITDCIPGFSMKSRFPGARPVTPRSIMTHRSGIPCNWLPMYGSPGIDLETMVAGLSNEYLAYPPEHLYAYSNAAMGVLGLAVERVSGMKFNDYMTENVLLPLGMKRSSFVLRDDMAPLFAKCYDRHVPSEDYPLCIDPSGSLYSSVNEMSGFVRMVVNRGTYGGRELLKPETLDEMLTPQTGVPLDLDAVSTVGLNWVVNDWNPYWGRRGFHAGGTFYFLSALEVLLDHKIGIIILTNSKTDQNVLWRIKDELLGLYLPEIFGPPGEYFKTNAADRFPKVVLKPDSGWYATMLGPVNIVKNGESLYAEAYRFPFVRIEFVPGKDGWYDLKPLLFGFIPIGEDRLSGLRIGTARVDGLDVLVQNRGGFRSVAGEKIAGIPPLSETWRKRCGRYRDVDGKGAPWFREIEIKEYRGMLVAEVYGETGKKSWEPVALTPISDEGLLIRGMGRNMHEVIRVVTVGGEERLAFEGCEFVKI